MKANLCPPPISKHCALVCFCKLTAVSYKLHQSFHQKDKSKALPPSGETYSQPSRSLTFTTGLEKSNGNVDTMQTSSYDASRHHYNMDGQSLTQGYWFQQSSGDTELINNSQQCLKTNNFIKSIPLSLKFYPPSLSIKSPPRHTKLCVVKETKCSFFFLQAIMESRKGLTTNQLGFSSTKDINYDNLDILVVKASKQENYCFQVPAKPSLWHHHGKAGS